MAGPDGGRQGQEQLQPDGASLARLALVRVDSCFLRLFTLFMTTIDLGGHVSTQRGILRS